MKRYLLALVVAVLLAVIVFALPTVDFVPPTMADYSTTTNTHYELNVSISMNELMSVVFDWNGTNTTLYDVSILALTNFDNFSSLGEDTNYAADISPYGNDPTIANALPVKDGKYNGAFTFDGSDDYMTYPISKANLQGGFTISFWIKPTGSQSGVGVLQAASELTSGIPFILLQRQTPTTLYWYLNENYQILVPGVPDDTWSFITLTYDGTTYKNYLNGLENGTYVGGLGSFGADNIYLGNGWAGYFNGLIDEFQVFNRSLSAGEVNQSMMSNLYATGFSPTDLVFYSDKTNLVVGAYTYAVFAKNSSNDWTTTGVRHITLSSSCSISTGLDWTINSAENCTFQSKSLNFSSIYFKDSGSIVFNDCNITAKRFARQPGENGNYTKIYLLNSTKFLVIQ